LLTGPPQVTVTTPVAALGLDLMPQYPLSMFQEEGAPSRPHAKTPGRS
jgi:hypothetical protein